MTDERRSETRIDEKTTIFIEVCSSSFDNTSPANIIICNSIDLSANGIQVEIDQEVAIGSILRLCAEFNDSETLYLVGETKWVKPAGDHFNIGFELYDAENTDIVGWKKLVASLLN
ncbi:PilZ domain-containing protein [Oceanicoccus sagamiensis]|uniref:PilZ domain-containing protein n=1 Tax=Oceanicoccus sagamiensis TaxID=716816 RepID=A0A1X9NDN0_9GAMM|nr:PilZ domain-containing protein [Oceanicoccus sagamiensis]ARN73649.1 hypothetical protein BST96_05660 [Oceanicoccus sagamiensis]